MPSVTASWAHAITRPSSHRITARLDNATTRGYLQEITARFAHVITGRPSHAITARFSHSITIRPSHAITAHFAHVSTERLSHGTYCSTYTPYKHTTPTVHPHAHHFPMVRSKGDKLSCSGTHHFPLDRTQGENLPCYRTHFVIAKHIFLKPCEGTWATVESLITYTASRRNLLSRVASPHRTY